MGLSRMAAVFVLLLGGLFATASPASAQEATIHYRVAAWGDVSTDVEAFAAHVSSTLDHPDGWSLGGSIDFVPVSSGDDVEILISDPATIGAVPGCSAEYSCHVSGTVYINEERWHDGAPGWSGSLDAYRHYVVNHEVGHHLGLGHSDCPAAGAEAPVMMQQTIETDPCVNRVWPLPGERQAVADRYGVPVREASEEAVEFARDLYRRVLARTPSDGDAAGLAERIDRGDLTRAGAAAGMVSSAEFDAVTAAMGRLYYAAFLRAPDPSGVLHWAAEVQAGYPPRAVAGDFAASDEFRARYGELDAAGFVDRLYRNVLGRPAEPEGQQYWVDQLESGATRGDVLDHFAHGAEHRQRRGVQVEVALYYAMFLDRYGDPDGVSYWTEEIERGAARVDVVHSFLTSGESVL